MDVKRLCVDLAKIVNNRRAVNSDKTHLVVIMVFMIIIIINIISSTIVIRFSAMTDIK